MPIIDQLLETTFWSNTLLHWSFLLIGILLTVILTRLALAIILKTLEYFTKKTKTTIDDRIIDIIRAPLRLLLYVVGIYLSISFVTLPSAIELFTYQFFRSVMIITLFWTLYGSVDLLRESIRGLSKRFGRKLSSEVSKFIIRFIEIFIFVIGTMTLLQEWGFNVSGFVASLGLGGLAIALAAKDTAANIFGSLVIFTDRPFIVGDWIKTPDVEGTIQEIGIRSTKVRTFAQAVVAVPNAVLANSAIINWSRMGKRRIKTTIGLTYSTSKSQLENIMQDLRIFLQEDVQIDQETIFVNFEGFGASSLDIFCYFFSKTTDWGEHMKVKERILLEFMQIITEKHGASFAFPSRSVYLENKDLSKVLN